jgi:hypothetical protein
MGNGTTLVNTARPEARTAESITPTAAPPSANGTMPSANRNDLRRLVHDGAATTAATTADEMRHLKEQVSKFVNSTFDNRELRGLSQEKRHQAFTTQLDKLAEERNLTPAQKESLRQEFLKLEAERTVQRTKAINQKLAEVSRRDNDHAFEQEQMKERLTKAFEELREVAGNSTPPAEWQEITARFEQMRQDERRALMMREVQTLGKNSVELGSALNTPALKQHLIAIRKKYADVGGVNPEDLVSTFQSSYDREYDNNLSQQGFFDRKYYQAKRFVTDCGSWFSDGLESLKSIGEGFSNAVSEVGAAVAGAGKLGKDLVVWGAEKTTAAVKATAAFAVTAVTDPAAALAQVGTTAVRVGEVVGSGASWVADKAVVGVTAVINGVCYAAEGAMELGALVMKGDFRKAGELLWNAGSSALTFAKGMCDNLGLTQIAVGASHLVMAQVDVWRDLYRVATGQGTLRDVFRNYTNHMVGAAEAVKGAVICLGEVTGVTDLCLAGKHSLQALAAYGRGDTMGAMVHLGHAAMHGTFAAMSAGSIAATVATGGAAAGSIAAVALGRATLQQAGKQVLKVAAKEFLEAGAKEIGQIAVKRMGAEAVQLVEREMGSAALAGLRNTAMKELGAGATAEAQQALVQKLALEAVLKREGAAIALQGAEGLARQVGEQGAQALAKDNVQAVMRDVAEARTNNLLSKLKLSSSVRGLTRKMLEDVSTKKTSVVAEELIKNLGIVEEKAIAMVATMRKALERGTSDQAMKQILEDGITAQVKEVIEAGTKDSFQTTFKRSLTGEVEESWAKSLRESVETEAKRLGKSVDSYADELVEAGWKGAREGIENATRASVREGIEKAFKEFRKRNFRLHIGASDGDFDASHGDGGLGSAGAGQEKPALRVHNPDAGRSHVEKQMSQVVTHDLGGGRFERVKMVYDPAAERWMPEGEPEIITMGDAQRDSKAA